MFHNALHLDFCFADHIYDILVKAPLLKVLRGKQKSF